MRMDFVSVVGRNERIDEIGENARVAEESGFSHMAFVDQPFMSRDVVVMMTIAALNTRRIRIGHGVTDPETHPPLVIASSAATLNELSGGRFFAGIGAGGPYGKVMKPVPLKRLREAVEFVRKFTAGEEVELNGQKVRSEFAHQQVPICVAAESRRSLEMAGEIGDMVFTMGGPPHVLKWKIDQVLRGAEKAGRNPSEVDIWVHCLMYVAESKEKARREVAPCQMQHCGLPGLWDGVVGSRRVDHPDPEIAALLEQVERENPGILDEIRRVRAVWEPRWHEHPDAPHAKLVTQRMIDLMHLTGTPEDICEGIYKLQKAGVRTLAIANYTIIDKKGMMREIGDKIMPHFR